MNTYVLGIVCVLLLFAVAATGLYSMVGWTSFAAKSGDVVSWDPKGAPISSIKFSDCKFTVIRSDGVTASKDVTPILQGMANAYKGTEGQVLPSTLSLDKPLNAFSFTIPGFNDSTTVSNSGAPPWCTASGDCSVTKVLLVGKYKVI